MLGKWILEGEMGKCGRIGRLCREGYATLRSVKSHMETYFIS